MNFQVKFMYCMEAFMRQALVTGLLAGAVVFTGGILFGWEYSMLLAFVVLFGVALLGWLRR